MPRLRELIIENDTNCMGKLLNTSSGKSLKKFAKVIIKFLFIYIHTTRAFGSKHQLIVLLQFHIKKYLFRMTNKISQSTVK